MHDKVNRKIQDNYVASWDSKQFENEMKEIELITDSNY